MTPHFTSSYSVPTGSPLWPLLSYEQDRPSYEEAPLSPLSLQPPEENFAAPPFLQPPPIESYAQSFTTQTTAQQAPLCPSSPDLIIVGTTLRTISRAPPSAPSSSSIQAPEAKRRRVEQETTQAPASNLMLGETTPKIEKLSKMIKNYFIVASPLNEKQRRDITRVAIMRANLSAAEITQLCRSCINRLKLYNPRIYEDTQQTEAALHRLIDPFLKCPNHYGRLSEEQKKIITQKFIELQDIFLEN